MNILVTGGGGFLGRHIVKQLLARGDFVRVFGRRGYPDLAESGVTCIRGDLTDVAMVDVASEGVDGIIHTAALAGIWGRRRAYYDTNILGTEHVIDVCQQRGIQRLVYTSTPSVVYGREAIIGGDETLPYPNKYLTHYAETKAIAERAVLAANHATNLRTCALRPHLIWGPGDTNLIPRLTHRAREGRLLQIGDGTNEISVSYVEDVAAAHVAALDHLTPKAALCGEAYFINAAEPVNCWSFIGELLRGFKCPSVHKTLSLKKARRMGVLLECLYRLLRVESEPPMTRFLALQLATSHWFRIDKARRDFGWEPRISHAEALARTIKGANL